MRILVVTWKERLKKERKKERQEFVKILETRSEFLTFPEPFTQGLSVCKGRPALSVVPYSVPIDGLTDGQPQTMNASHLLPPFALRFMHFFSLKKT